ncbi:MAG: phytanoyl-CoA dioxygenase family protein [Amylibacter sp.]|nr:phytanoyl-CoA dioxygenase family protein [Amylibacter sp.]
MILNATKLEQFHRDGFIIIDNFLDPAFAQSAADRFAPLFRGEFPTGLYPDEWNWREGRDPDNLTRQICNGWKSDPTIAAVTLSATIGQLCAQLGGWPGARIGQDNVLWKPPGAAALGFHQDDSYCKWITPPNYITCWIGLDATSAKGGTLEYVPGSHKWGDFPPIRQFHAPDDYHEALKMAAAEVGQVPEFVKVEVPAGGCAFHAGGTWHGSGANNSTQPRRSIVAHCISSDAKFHPTNVSYIYNRYKRHNSLNMDEDFFPVLWAEDGHRTAWLDPVGNEKKIFASKA